MSDHAFFVPVYVRASLVASCAEMRSLLARTAPHPMPEFGAKTDDRQFFRLGLFCLLAKLEIKSRALSV